MIRTSGDAQDGRQQRGQVCARNARGTDPVGIACDAPQRVDADRGVLVLEQLHQEGQHLRGG